MNNVYIQEDTRVIAVVKDKDRYEYDSSPSFNLLAEDLTHKETYSFIDEYWEENNVPEDQRILL